MTLEQQNYSKTTTKKLLASLHLKICYIWRYRISLKCVVLFNYLPYKKKKILLTFNLLLFWCYLYNIFLHIDRNEEEFFSLQQHFTYIRIFVTYLLRTSELFIFPSQSFLELLQPSFLLFSGHFQTELNLSGESAVTKTSRILFQDLTSAVAGGEIAVT